MKRLIVFVPLQVSTLRGCFQNVFSVIRSQPTGVGQEISSYRDITICTVVHYDYSFLPEISHSCFSLETTQLDNYGLYTYIYYVLWLHKLCPLSNVWNVGQHLCSIELSCCYLNTMSINICANFLTLRTTHKLLSCLFPEISKNMSPPCTLKFMLFLKKKKDVWKLEMLSFAL